MRIRMIVCCFVLAFLAGCVPPPQQPEPAPRPRAHSMQPGPQHSDRRYEADRRMCAERVGPIPAGPERDRAIDDCLTRLGWRPRN